MTRRSRHYRVLNRARKAFSRSNKRPMGYDDRIMPFLMRMLRLTREFNEKYPRQIPKFTYGFIRK